MLMLIWMCVMTQALLPCGAQLAAAHAEALEQHLQTHFDAMEFERAAASSAITLRRAA